MKKRILITISIIACLSMLFGINAKAETYKWPATSNIKTYVKSTGNDTTVYKTALSTQKYGTIYASDLITINGYSLSRLKVTYPISGGTKTGYIPVSAVTSGKINKASEKWTATSQITTYRRSGGGSTMGYIAKGDVCYTIATLENWKQVIYPISGGYKIGWLEDKTSQNTEVTQKNTTTETTSNWQYPMKNWYCTWRTKTNNSWSEINEDKPKDRNEHVGIDLRSDKDSNVYAASNGTVIYKGYTSGNGYHVVLSHKIGGTTVKSLYSHLQSYSACPNKGKSVKAGQKIGVYGKSGLGNVKTGHLHFAIYKGSSNDPWGYASSFSGNKTTYNGLTFYNPNYVIKYNKLP
jgi:murein DD-endopeptidase MepM/ murein hydrolase activator NlpD